MKKFYLLSKTLLVAVCLLVGGANLAWGDDLPTPVYTQDFESASTTVGSAGYNFGITGATLTGSGSIETGDALFGKYYKNAKGVASSTSRANYLTLTTTAFSSMSSPEATTISFWVNAYDAAWGNYWGSMFVAYGSAGNTSHGYPFSFDTRSCLAVHSSLYETYFDNNGLQINDWRTNGDNFTSSWHHVALVYSADNSDVANKKVIIKQYIDGTLKQSYTLENGNTDHKDVSIFNNFEQLTEIVIGGNSPVWEDEDNNFAYDEIAIYDQALTAEQVATISEKFNYTVKAVDGSSKELKVLATGKGSPNATISYAYPHYINVNGTLYYKDKVNTDPNYGGSFSLAKYNKVENVVYAASTYTNVVYFKEAEEVLSSNTSDNVKNRCSNQAGGYASTATKITTLRAGTYKMYFATYASEGRTFYVYKNSESEENKLIGQAGNGTWKEYETEEFILTKASPILVKGGDSNFAFDYFIITGTPSHAVLGDPYYSNWEAYASNLSNKVTLEPGQSYSYKFTNYNHTAYNWDNYIVPVYDGETLKHAIRADFWEDVAGANTGCEANIVWDNFNSDMNGATIDMNISYTSDNLIKMQTNITTSSSSKWFYNYTSPSALTAEEVKVALGANWCWIELIKEGSAIATMNALGYTTFSSINKLDLDHLPDGLTAYYATSVDVDDDVVRLTEATGVVPGETGLILKGTANTVYEIPTSTGEATALSGNLLVACPYRTSVETDANKYVLVNNSGTMEFQSLADNGATMPMGKAYLNAGTNPGARLSIVFDEGTSAIKDMDASSKHGVLVEGKFFEEGKMVIVKNGMKFNANGQKVK